MKQSQVQRQKHHRAEVCIEELPEPLDVSEVLKLAELAIEHIDEVI